MYNCFNLKYFSISCNGTLILKEVGIVYKWYDNPALSKALEPGEGGG